MQVGGRGACRNPGTEQVFHPLGQVMPPPLPGQGMDRTLSRSMTAGGKNSGKREARLQVVGRAVEQEDHHPEAWLLIWMKAGGESRRSIKDDL